MTSQQMHIFKYVQTHITEIHQQVSVTPVTIRVSYNKNSISMHIIVQDGDGHRSDRNILVDCKNI